MKTKNILWFIGILVVAGAAYFFISQRPKGAKNTPAAPTVVTGEAITIGAVLPLADDCGGAGDPLRRAIQMAVDEINSARGALGRPLRVQFEDGRCASAEEAAAAKRLVDASEVKYIIGAASLGAFADENKVIVIAPTGAAEDGKFLFSFAPAASSEGMITAAYAVKELGSKKAAVISEQTDYGQSRRSGFKEAVKSAGGKVVADETFRTGETNFRNPALRVRAAKADVVYVVSESPDSAVLIIKQLKENGVAAALLASDNIFRPEIVTANAADLEDVTGFEPVLDEKSEWGGRFIEAYQTKFSEIPPAPLAVANAYSITYLIKDLIEQNQLDAEKAQKSLAALSGWAGGALANVDLDADGNIIWKSYTVKQVVGGALKDIKVFTAE